ncbi:MAG: hypothetical protein JWM75_2632 [Sphingomonas bacterium]|nr:hypothetical protein [Sphingomonas bacterium]
MRALMVLLLVSETAGLAADPGQPATATKAAKDSVVCRQQLTTGTRIRSSECHLKSEWVEIDLARRKQYEELQRRMASGAGADRPPSNSAYTR